MHTPVYVASLSFKKKETEKSQLHKNMQIVTKISLPTGGLETNSYLMSVFKTHPGRIQETTGELA